ncbi:hypothetical protein BROUX41_001161 [Berkeleyomyces rouxiae]|uniref:uncharacterized protein n=1 Tax=Berkeleyomyces rouxiae TaxID=2035830 RepID=UPI003B7B7F9A
MCCSPCSNDLFLGLLAILFPPVAVWVKRGICSADSVINILLCVLGYLPGLLHAWYIIAKYPGPVYEYQTLGYDEEGRVTYVIVRHDQGQSQGQIQPPRNAPMHYGATAHSAPAQGRGQGSQQRPQQAHSAAGPSNGGEGGSDGSVPPSYAEVVAGDNKIQR